MTSSALGKLKLKTQDENRYGKIVYNGYMDKKSKGSTWTKKWAVLWEDTALRFYESDERGNVFGKIKMKHVDTINIISDSQSIAMNPDKPYFFSIVSKSQKKSWQFGCDDNESLNQWVHILRSALTIKKQKVQQEKQEKSKPKKDIDIDVQYERNSNQYIGHHGRNMSNMDDFSRSSRLSSIQTLSGLSIMQNDLDKNNKWNANSIINDIINEDKDDEFDRNHDDDDDDDDLFDIEFQIKRMEENISNKLQMEDSKILFEGYLERKTKQKALGKHLWETRYFKLSTHSLLIYQNDKSNLTESIIKLSHIISVNRNIKHNGNDLKINRFDIHIKGKNNGSTEVIELKTDKETDCKQWINYLLTGKRKHRISIRNNLKSIQEIKNRTNKKTKKTVKTFKRQKTSRKLTDDEENNDNINVIKEEEDDQFSTNPQVELDKNDKNTHSRNLSMRSWANSISEKHENQLSSQNLKDLKKEIDGNSDEEDIISHFEGFLIRKIGKTADQIGEKIFIRLRDDILEFSKIEQITNDEDELNKYHLENLLGTISIEHIKSVKMIENENDNEFVIVFNEYDANTDWTLTVPDNVKETDIALKWVKILQTAHNDAEQIENTILGNKNNQSNQSNKKTEKPMGSIKALAKMINDETVMEMAAMETPTDITDNNDGYNIKTALNEENNNNRNTGCSCICL